MTEINKHQIVVREMTDERLRELLGGGVLMIFRSKRPNSSSDTSQATENLSKQPEAQPAAESTQEP